MKLLEKFNIKVMADGTWYTAKETNNLGEKLIIQVSSTHSEGRNSFAELWYKFGFTNKKMHDYLSVHTYVEDTEGSCCGCYNVCVKFEDGRNVLDFDWLLEPTEDNTNKIINAIYDKFINASGLTATERRINRVIEHCKVEDREWTFEKPAGWRKVDYYDDRSWLMDNGESQFIARNVVNPNYKSVVYIEPFGKIAK